jgi:hypothetical protein
VANPELNDPLDDQAGADVAIIAGQNASMERFDVAAGELLPGQQVRVRALSHQPWGVVVEIVGHEGVGASIDMIELFGRGRSDQELAELTPAIGTEIDAVVEQIAGGILRCGHG